MDTTIIIIPALALAAYLAIGWWLMRAVDKSCEQEAGYPLSKESLAFLKKEAKE